MIVLKLSRTNLTALISILNDSRTVVVLTFFIPLITNVSGTAMLIFRDLWGAQNAQTKKKLDPQARWEIYRELIMKVIEACVLYPAILLNALEALSQLNSRENKVNNFRIDVREPASLTSIPSSLTACTKVSFVRTSGLVLV